MFDDYVFIPVSMRFFLLFDVFILCHDKKKVFPLFGGGVVDYVTF